MKVASRSKAVERYGGIDFSAKYWPMQSHFLVPLELSPDWFPSFKVLDTSHPVHIIYCNLDMRLPLQNAFKAVHDKGLGNLLRTYDGCFNIRMVRGDNSHFSAHSYGLAIDLNAEENQLGSVHGGFYNYPDFVKCFLDQGFDWGGNFHGRKDPMHFSYCWEHP